MNHRSLVFVLVALLSATAIASAQTQRWEYARLYKGIVGFNFDTHNSSASASNIKAFIQELEGAYGTLPRHIASPADPALIIDVYNALGWNGWELVACFERDSDVESEKYEECFFKRPASSE